MRLFVHLLRREAADVRWLVRGGLAAIAALVLLTYWGVNRLDAGAPFDAAGDIARFWIAGAAILGGGAVAAEAFGGDASSRRVDGAALLPLGLGPVLAAKAVVTLTATALFGMWAAGWAPAAAALFASETTALGAFGAGADTAGLLGAAVYVVGAMALAAVLLEHGFGSIVMGFAVAAGGFMATMILSPWDDWGLPSPGRPGGGTALALCVVGVVLWVAAAAAFVRGPIHLSRRFRRAAIGLGVSVGVLVPAGWATAAVLESRADLEPGDAVVVSAVVASPDGRHAVMFVGASRVPAISRAWLVDLATGDVRVLPGKHRTFHGWDPDGSLRLWEGTRAGRVDVIDTFDPATGAWLRARSEEQWNAEPHDEHWARVQKTTDGVVVEWRDRGVKRRLDGAWIVSVSPRPGVMLVGTNGRGAHVVDLAAGRDDELPAVNWGSHTWIDGGRLLRYHEAQGDRTRMRTWDAETHEVRDAPALPGRWPQFGDGPYAVVWMDAKRRAVVDVRDGRVVLGGEDGASTWFVRGTDRWAVRQRARSRSALVDCASGREIALDIDPNRYGWAANLIAALPGERFLVAGPADRVGVVGADGTSRSIALRRRDD